MDPTSVLVGCALGFLLSLGAFWLLFVARRAEEASDPVRDVIDRENVTSIEKWKARRAETDRTFGRWGA